MSSANIFNEEAAGNATKFHGFRQPLDGFGIDILEGVGDRVGASTIHNGGEDGGSAGGCCKESLLGSADARLKLQHFRGRQSLGLEIAQMGPMAAELLAEVKLRTQLERLRFSDGGIDGSKKEEELSAIVRKHLSAFVKRLRRDDRRREGVLGGES